jgi:asparagine synthase (glutamine-hydrolysing)
MSGIVGIVNLDGAPVDRDLLRRMTDSMSFRGPDAQQVWIAGDVGFGHTMLRTTWEAETEKQPLTLDRQVSLTADARVDGRAELIEKLERRLGRSFALSELNDAELILLAYEAWKEDCVNHLVGDFAFAIWDSRSRRLFCARDHFGVKPFFYAHTGNSFVFSNTLKTLRLDPRVSDAFNETAIGDFLLFGLNQDLSTTTFRDIQRLPAGHSLSISNYSLTPRRYWTAGNTDETEVCVEEFQELLTATVRDRLRTNRVAVSMSGGLDSTSIAAIAKDLCTKHSAVSAFSVVYDDLIPDEERHYSTAAAEFIDVPITHLNGDAYRLFDGDLDQPEPFLLGPLIGQFHELLRLCAGNGRVALTGFDGDAFMNEPPRNYFASCARKLKIKDLLSSMAWYARTHRSPPPVGFRTLIKRTFRRQAAESFYPEWIDESFAMRTNLRDRCKQFISDPIIDGGTHAAAFHALDSKVWAPLFEGYDPGATRIPLEMRHPLIDVRLLGYLFAIPAMPWCVNKHILRVAMSNRLPAEVLKRPKTPLAGNPALQLARRAGVRWLDSFEINPQLEGFVNLNLRRPLAEEPTPEGLWANLRLFALNYWLTNSLPIERPVENSLVQTA